MKVNGIIAEYNPFHNGHKYHMEDAKTHTQADYTIVVMSGNFVQRGAPALLDKYSRAKIALSNGADLVLELPCLYATSSAEYFANGGVSLLDKLGVVDHLCFGSECGEIAILKRIAEILLEEPESYVTALRSHLKQGLSYPIARTTALLQYEPSLSSYKDVLSSPNNILGIEYLKALMRRKSAIQPFTTLRSGADYHDRRLGNSHCSALAIRHAFFSGSNMDFLKDQMPDSAYDIVKTALADSALFQSKDFSAALHYKLLSEKEKGYIEYLDITPELSERIRNNLNQFIDFDSFCELLKSKDMTYTRISRCLLHIFLGITDLDMALGKDLDFVPYARVLGFKKSSSALLTAIKENSSIPLITKLADAGNILDEEAFTFLEKEIHMNEIYLSTASIKTGKAMPNEYSTPIVIL